MRVCLYLNYRNYGYLDSMGGVNGKPSGLLVSSSASIPTCLRCPPYLELWGWWLLYSRHHIMYNFNAHTLNGVAVSYSSLPNFALDIIERDERLTLASKMIYIRLLRYASMIKQTAFRITAVWLSDNIVINRNTISRSIVQLKQYGYMTDKGIVIPDNMTYRMHTSFLCS